MEFLKTNIGKKLIEQKRIFVLRYEDFGGSPLKIQQQIYDFFKLDTSGSAFSISKDYLKLLTNNETKARYGTSRNSSATIFNWVGQLDYRAVTAIQNYCGDDVMAGLGYRMYRNEQKYHDEKQLEIPVLNDWMFKNRFYRTET